MVYTEIDILNSVKEQLWNGKGKFKRFPLNLGTNEYICHILSFIRENELCGEYTEAYINIKEALGNYCGEFSSYASVLIDHGIVSFHNDDFTSICQKQRMLLVDQMIASHMIENELAHAQE